MSIKKIIPCLDVHNGRVVKGINFINLVDVGDPVENAKLYSDAKADELVFLDISATTDNRDTIVDLVKKVAESVDIPLTVGGGIRSVEDFERVLNAGASKVSINSSAVKTPEVINDIAGKFGSDKLVVAIDAKKNNSNNNYNVYVNGGKTDTGLDVVVWAKEVEKRGAGEILLTSMDCDGKKDGYDLVLTNLVATNVTIPVVASGGAGKMAHFYEAFTEGNAASALSASLFHFREVDIKELKSYLKEKGVSVNL